MKIIKGKVQPMDDSEKTNAAIKKALSTHSVWERGVAWAHDISVDSTTDVPTNSGKRYTIKGNCKVTVKRHKDGATLPAVTTKFRVQFEDSRDQYGLPDVKVNDYEFAALK